MTQLCKPHKISDQVNNEFYFTPKNLLRNLRKLGPWSSYGLASDALRHYFPEEYGDDKITSVEREAELLGKLGCQYWQDAIRKYHKEVGYTAAALSNKNYVNAY